MKWGKYFAQKAGMEFDSQVPLDAIPDIEKALHMNIYIIR
jgi:hypothetical protein